jgi:hypothetical protein
MAISMVEGLLAEAFHVMRKHGAGRAECVVYLTGPLSQTGVVDEVLHPSHHASPDLYEIDRDWLNSAWFELARRRREIRVQVHLHGGRAYHSAVDDAYPAIQTPGFLSLVIPDFAAGDVGLSNAYLARLRADGGWDEVDPHDELVLL